MKWSVHWLNLSAQLPSLTSPQWSQLLSEAPRAEYDELVDGPRCGRWSRSTARRRSCKSPGRTAIADATLDDRVVELLKIQLVRDLRGELSPDHHFHLVEVTGNVLVFERTHPDGLIRAFPIPRRIYDALAQQPELAAWIDLAFPDGLLIDHRARLVPEADDVQAAAP